MLGTLGLLGFKYIEPSIYKKLKFLNFIIFIRNNAIQLLILSIFMKIEAHLGFESKLRLAGGTKSDYKSAIEIRVI